MTAVIMSRGDKGFDVAQMLNPLAVSYITIDFLLQSLIESVLQKKNNLNFLSICITKEEPNYVILYFSIEFPFFIILLSYETLQE
jgi:hypothetical protein